MHIKHSSRIDMTKIILNILFLFAAVEICAQNCTATLQIETNKDSSLIFVDDNFKGFGRIKIEVNPGKYFIGIKENTAKWNGQEIYDSVNIKLCGKEYLRSYNLSDKIYIETKPDNAAIFVYDSLTAFSPNFVSVDQFQTVKLKKGNAGKSFHSSELSAYNNISLDFTTAPRNGSFTNSTWFKVLLGSAAVFGATAAYYKIQADKKYDQYVEEKNPVLLDDVDRYDLYSGVAFGLLQINFGYLIYRFLTD